jgi:hypothetical protein
MMQATTTVRSLSELTLTTVIHFDLDKRTDPLQLLCHSSKRQNSFGSWTPSKVHSKQLALTTRSPYQTAHSQQVVLHNQGVESEKRALEKARS